MLALVVALSAAVVRVVAVWIKRASGQRGAERTAEPGHDGLLGPARVSHADVLGGDAVPGEQGSEGGQAGREAGAAAGPIAGAPNPAEGALGHPELSAPDDLSELTIPEGWDRSSGGMPGFHLEVRRGEETITLSHDDLETWLHDQLYAMLRDNHVDEAADLLAEHSPLTSTEAQRFLSVYKDQA